MVVDAASVELHGELSAALELEAADVTVDLRLDWLRAVLPADLELRVRELEVAHRSARELDAAALHPERERRRGGLRVRRRRAAVLREKRGLDLAAHGGELRAVAAERQDDDTLVGVERRRERDADRIPVPLAQVLQLRPAECLGEEDRELLAAPGRGEIAGVALEELLRALGLRIVARLAADRPRRALRAEVRRHHEMELDVVDATGRLQETVRKAILRGRQLELRAVAVGQRRHVAVLLDLRRTLLVAVDLDLRIVHPEGRARAGFDVDRLGRKLDRTGPKGGRTRSDGQEQELLHRLSSPITRVTPHLVFGCILPQVPGLGEAQTLSINRLVFIASSLS